MKKKTKFPKAFLITSIATITLMTAVNAVALGVPFITNTISTLFGSDRRVIVSGDPSKIENPFKTDEKIKNKADALNYANSVNEKIGEEGFVLLKNDRSLPLKANSRISVYGMNQNNMVYSGSGSSSKSNDDGVNLFKALDNASISYNPTLKKFYDDKKKSGKGRPASPTFGDILDGFDTGELAMKEYDSSSPSSYAGDYKDAAVVVISRIGGEGYDLPRTMKGIAGADESNHYLELDNNEKALLSDLCSVSSPFENVIVLINSGTSMELGFLDDPSYNGKLKGALWIGDPGGTGLASLGRILNGEISPSGRLTDTYARDFTKMPSYNNFGNNMTKDGDRYSVDGVLSNYYFTDYEEGIYVGYRYYETRGYVEKGKGNDSWYQENVVFPFGYGLSYASFSYDVLDYQLEGQQLPSVLTADDLDRNINVTVKVTNDSENDVEAKDVVQLYGHAPYVDGGIEKSHVVLLDFAKTKSLKKGESDTITLTTTLRNLASYDFDDKNSNSHKGYELDKGQYALYVGKNAHAAWTDSISEKKFDINSEILIDSDEVTGNKIENQFDSTSEHIQKYLSRSDFEGTWPSTPSEQDRNISQELADTFTVENYIGDGSSLDKDRPWYSSKAPRQQYVELKYEDCRVQLADLMGKDYEDPLWDTLLSQLTLKQMATLIGTGNFNTAEISNIEKPKTVDPDGPSGFTNFMSVLDSTAIVYDTCFYACESLIGATYNKDLAKEVGNAIGNEALIGNERGDGSPYSGWYAPAVNIHRTPFSGRNWEYYSEDGLFNGIMASMTIQGAKEKGVYTYVKHFALNDSETHRDSMGLITWCNEQAMREIYLRPFELAVKKGKTTAMMSSFNRIGSVWAGGNYELLTNVLRKEWGFRGTVITDYNTHPEYMDPDQMIRAGGSLNLIQDMQPSTSGKRVNASHRIAMRNATHDILYTVANSCAMNGYGSGIRHGYAPAYWKIALYCVDGVLAAGLMVWGFFAIRRYLIAKKQDDVVVVSDK